jgi:hypothetical protein
MPIRPPPPPSLERRLRTSIQDPAHLIQSRRHPTGTRIRQQNGCGHAETRTRRRLLIPHLNASPDIHPASDLVSTTPTSPPPFCFTEPTRPVSPTQAKPSHFRLDYVINDVPRLPLDSFLKKKIGEGWLHGRSIMYYYMSYFVSCLISC